MRARTCLILLACALACGCHRAKSTDELIGDLNSDKEADRIKAIRLLPQHKGDAAKVIPALIDSLKDKKNDELRWSAAIGLGYFGEEAKEAIPALQEALRDKDARVREGAAVALSRIDPSKFQAPTNKSRGKK
jgi:HEAT repeat protein